jgi:transposase-like protein
MFLVRGLVFTHEAVRNWEAKLAPLLADALRRRRVGLSRFQRNRCRSRQRNLRFRERGKAGRCWHVDETDLKVAGAWCYLYRAIDRDGTLVDVSLSNTRDLAAARAFFRSAKSVTQVGPEQVTTDGHSSYPKAIAEELGKDVDHRVSQYKEADRSGHVLAGVARNAILS